MIFNLLKQTYEEILNESASTRGLIVLDENTTQEETAALSNARNTTILTNRYDLNCIANKGSVASFFSDFDFSQLTPPYEICAYRVAKERLVNHHILNQLRHVLKQDGTLVLAGKKSEGVKGYYQTLTKTCGFSGKLTKHKDNYIGALTKHHADYLLEDKQYPTLREIEAGFFSKPGLYGWNKIDSGSAFLVETLLGDIDKTIDQPLNIIDLGCGYGFLSRTILQATQAKGIQIAHLHATDNNAAAILATQRNLAEFTQSHDINISVSADDCGKKITTQCDLLICNPPFHLGFDNSTTLSDKFASQSSRLLHKEGSAYFVVNAFIPLEAIAQKYFNNVRAIANNNKFKVIKAQK